MKLFWPATPKPCRRDRDLLGWVAVIAATQIRRSASRGSRSSLIGGLFYTVGAIVYARRRPDPKPAVLGYHELFHLCTIAAAACQYVAIAFFVLRAARDRAPAAQHRAQAILHSSCCAADGMCSTKPPGIRWCSKRIVIAL